MTIEKLYVLKSLIEKYDKDLEVLKQKRQVDAKSNDERYAWYESGVAYESGKAKLDAQFVKDVKNIVGS